MSKPDTTKADLAKHWLREIAAYDTRQKKARWNMWARHAVDQYTLTIGDNRTVKEPADDTVPRYNIFWSNVENLKPGMYSRTPKPVVSRRQNATKNPVASMGATVLERVLAYQLSEHGFGAAIRAARDDYLLTGRGVAWVRYVPHILKIGDALSEIAEDESGNTPPTQEMLAFEEAMVDYVHWSDFGHTDARRWEDVRAVWRRIRLDNEQVEERWGKEWADKLAYDSPTVRSDTTNTDSQARNDDDESASGLASVYEVWDSRKRQIVFVAKGQKEPLDVISDDPLGLPRFFACSRPIYATLANEDLFATSDYRQYRTQIKQIQDLTQRINSLTDAVKVVGAYDASVPELKDIFKQPDNKLVPVTNWAALAGKGGLDGTISLIPMKEIAETLTILHDERDKALNDSYQLTGISDLVRGDTQASETATAQTIKNNYITMRFDEKKREVDRCVVNTLDIMASIICRQFADASIIEMSGMDLFPTVAEKQQCEQAVEAAKQPPQPPQPGMPPQPPVPIPDERLVEMCDHPTWEEVIQFLRDEPERRFAVDVETDSTVAADQAQQQQGAVAYLTAVGGFLKSATDAGQATPELVPLMGKMLEWGSRQFPIGRDLEDAISSAVDDLEKATRNAAGQPPKPDPVMAKVQGELKLAQEKQQADQQLAQAKFQADQQLRQADQQHAHGMAVAGAQSDAAQDQQQNEQSIQLEAVKAHFAALMAQQAAEAKAQTDILIAHIQNLGKIEVARIGADAAADADAEANEEAKGA